MARRVVACTACAATWTDRRARYCGRCGVPLGGSGDLPPGTDTAARRRARLRLAGILTAAVAAAVLAVAASVTDLLSFQRGGDPEVALPTPEVLPTGNRLEPDETRALRQQVDPNRLRCEPRGCELWRRSMPSGSVSMGYMGVIGLDDLVVMLEYTDLVALDRGTGELRWREPLDDLLPDGATIARDGANEWQLLTAIDDDAVVVSTPHHVALVGEGGHRRWVMPVTSQFWAGEVVDGRILLHGDRSGREALTVLDADDGSIVWEREGSFYTTQIQDGYVLTSSSRRVEVMSLADGQVVWSHEFGPDSPFFGGTHHETWLADNAVMVVAPDTGQLAVFDMATGLAWTREYDAGGWPVLADTWVAFPQSDSPDVTLVDTATGAELTTFANATINEWTEVEDAWVLLLTPRDIRPDDNDERHPRGARLVAIDRDGDVMWEHAVEMERRCCTWLAPGDPGVVAVMTDGDTAGTVTALRVDVASGTILEVTGDAANPGAHGWQATDGTWVGWGDNDVTLRRGDHSARVFPANVWPQLEGTPWIFATDSEIIGVQLMPDE